MKRTLFAQAGVVVGLALLVGCGGDVAQPLPSPFVAVTAGLLHSCGLVADGTAFCWGNNQFGQLGDGSTSRRTFPVPVSGTVRFASLSPGGGHTCGIATTGAAYCWGYNLNGQVGDATHSDHAVPAAVDGGRSWMALSAGGSLTCGIAADSTAYCWGWNQFGQLGDSSTADAASPQAVTGGHKFVSISAGSFHACGVTPGGQAYCWGNNDYGQLGTGDQTASPVPVAVQGGVVFASIEAGYYHSCGLTGAGTGYCWGYNAFGQLGVGDSLLGQAQAEPMEVAGTIVWRGLSTGAYFSCGVEEGTGVAYCWGLNSSGQLGADVPGTCYDQNNVPFQCVGEPFVVSGGLAFDQVSPATQHTCGLTPDKVAYCWGLDSDGQLGDGQNGTTVFANQPVKVGGQP